MPNKTDKQKIKLLLLPFILFRSILWITFIFILVSCNTTEPPPKVINGTAELTVEDVSSTEAWLSLKTQNINLPAELKLFREDSVTQIINLSSADTLLYDEGLQPNQTYTYHSIISSFQNSAEVKSNNANLTTLDTTSHNFSWQTYTFGGSGGSSYLNDVAIISENDIWAVGEINIADTSQNGYTTYNAVHWDGNSWELKRIMWDNSASRLTCVLAFASDDVWFGVTNLIHWNGNNFEKNWNPILNEFTDKTVNAMWGTSSSDFYVVGNNGKIAHYNGSEWSKIESGTDLNINDIWGDYNKKNGEYEILAVASKILQSTDRDILKISNTGVEKLDETGINWSLHGIWFKNSRKYYAVGSGIYRKNKMTDKRWDNNWQQITQYYINSVRGKEINDVFMCGAFGEVLHYNGKSWYSYLNKGLPYFNGSMVKLSYKRNKVCIVGSDGRVGIIYLGTKN